MERAAPLIAKLTKHARRAHETGDVHVVATCMHSVNCIAMLIDHLFFAGVRQAGLLLHRQAIHVGTDEQRWAEAIFQDANNPVTADPGSDRQSGRPQLGGQALGRLDLHE